MSSYFCLHLISPLPLVSDHANPSKQLSRSKSHDKNGSKKRDLDKKSTSSLRSESSSSSLKKDNREKEIKDRESSKAPSASDAPLTPTAPLSATGVAQQPKSDSTGQLPSTLQNGANPVMFQGINVTPEPQWNNDNDGAAPNDPTEAGALPQLHHPSLVVSPTAHAPPGATETMPRDLPAARYGSNSGQVSPQQRLSFERLGIDGIKTPQRHNSSRFEISEKRELEVLESFNQVPAKDRNALFLKKIEQCTVMFDFNDPSADILGKEIKQGTLNELLEYVSTHNIPITHEMYAAVVQMFAKNLFRTIPPPVNPVGDLFDPDEDEPVSEVSWPHMKLVYEFFLRFIESSDFNQQIAKAYIDHPFVQNLIELFDSEDSRERECLKTTLHRIYGKFLNLRAFIRRSINNVFFQFVYETERFNGIAELLEIMGSIINGFAIPLKEEHKVFLSRVLIPLHKTRSLSLYHSQLAYCVVQFLEKDMTLTEDVVMGLLRYWPKVNSPKEVLFLVEVEDIFEVMDPSEFVKIQVPLFVQLAKCISSTHFQVAERALYYWTHEYFCSLVSENSETILPIIFSALHDNYTANWNNNIHLLLCSATKMFMDANPMLYNQCANLYRESQEAADTREQLRKESWKSLEDRVHGLDNETLSTLPSMTTMQ